MIKQNKMWQDVITFYGSWVLNLQLQFIMLFYQRCGKSVLKYDKMWEDVARCDNTLMTLSKNSKVVIEISLFMKD